MLIEFLKLFGAKVIAAELASLIRRHVKHFDTLAAAFAAGARGCQDKSPDEVARALTDALFSIQ